ncbi:ArsA family ATPase [Chloroflexota bacterium]
MYKSSSDVTYNKYKLIIFGGKGGVGKTTSAAATALHYASLGIRTLIISTDATPSLSHIFEIKRNKRYSNVRDNLELNELGLEEVREMWNKKFGREVYEVFSSFVSIGYEEFSKYMTALLPGLSDEFMVDFIRELGDKGTYDLIIWDTAPLGQTLALLQTPAMLREHMKIAPRIYSRLKLGQKSKEPILGIIRRWERLSADNIDFLQNNIRFIMVTIPEALAVEQLQGAIRELKNYGINVQQIIINNVIKAEDSDFLFTKSRHQKNYIKTIYSKFSELQIVEIPMFPYEIKGLDRLKETAEVLFEAPN